jgi:hypothetical protein
MSTYFGTIQPFDASLFIEFRKGLGIDQIDAINEKILKLSQAAKEKHSGKSDDNGKAEDCSLLTVQQNEEKTPGK